MRLLSRGRIQVKGKGEMEVRGRPRAFGPPLCVVASLACGRRLPSAPSLRADVLMPSPRARVLPALRLCRVRPTGCSAPTPIKRLTSRRPRQPLSPFSLAAASGGMPQHSPKPPTLPPGLRLSGPPPSPLSCRLGRLLPGAAAPLLGRRGRGMGRSWASVGRLRWPRAPPSQGSSGELTRLPSPLQARLSEQRNPRGRRDARLARRTRLLSSLTYETNPNRNSIYSHSGPTARHCSTRPLLLRQSDESESDSVRGPGPGRF